MSLGNQAIVIGVSAIDNSKGILTGVDNNIRKTTTTIEQESAKAAVASDRMAARFKQNIGSIATTAAGMGAGIVGFATSFDTLEKAQYRSDKANLALQRSQELLNDKLASGKATANELAIAHEAVEQATEKARLAEDDLNDTYTNFFANVPAQLISFGVAANSVYSMIKTHQITTGASSVGMAATYNGALASMNTANIVTASTTHKLAMALKAAFITNPIGLILVGITTLIIALATNVGGLRDAFFEVGKAVYEFLYVHLRPLADLMKWFYDNILKPIGGALSSEIPEAAAVTSESFDHVAISTEKAADELNRYDEYMTELASKTETSKEENLLYLASMNKLGLAVGMTNDRLELMVEYMQDADREQRNLLQSNFKLVADTYGLQKALAMQNDEINLAAENLRKYKQYLDDATSSARSFKEATKPDDEQAGMRTEQSDFRMTGELGRARAKYPGLDLIKIGSNWLPKDVTVARRAMIDAQDALSRFKRRIGGDHTRTSLEQLRELQERAETTRSEYEQAKIALQVIINEREGGGYDVEAKVSDSQNRLRTTSQVISS